MPSDCSISYYPSTLSVSNVFLFLYMHTLLVPTNQRLHNKLSKERNTSGHKWSTTHSLLKSSKIKMSVIYMHTMHRMHAICAHIYYAHLDFVRFEHSVCHRSLWPLILRPLLGLLSTLWFIGTSNVCIYITLTLVLWVDDLWPLIFLFLDKLYLELSIRCLISYFKNYFFAKQLYSLDKKFLTSLLTLNFGFRQSGKSQILRSKEKNWSSSVFTHKHNKSCSM